MTKDELYAYFRTCRKQKVLAETKIATYMAAAKSNGAKDVILEEGNKCGDFKRPTLKLPQFSGKVDDFRDWFNTFNTCIGTSTKFNNVSKLVYLKSAISGSAAKLLSHLTVVDCNYQIAIDLLKSTYLNDNAEIMNTIDKIFKLEHPRYEYQSLVNFRANFECLLAALTAVDCPVNSQQPTAERIITQY